MSYWRAQKSPAVLNGLEWLPKKVVVHYSSSCQLSPLVWVVSKEASQAVSSRPEGHQQATTKVRYLGNMNLTLE